MNLPRHYQDGEPSLQSYDLRKCGEPGTLQDGDVEFYLAQGERQVGPFPMDGVTVGAPENVDAIKNNLCRKLDENCTRKARSISLGAVRRSRLEFLAAFTH